MGEFEWVPDMRKADIASYAGRWIALIDKVIVGQGGTPQQAIRAAKAARHKETPQIYYVPTMKAFTFPDILEQVCAVLPADQPVFLVGGAVRDSLLSRPCHDFDFVLPGNALRIARFVADKIGAAYYPLDKARQTARLILVGDGESRQILDFSAIKGTDLDADLAARDFTINAMAVDIREPQKLYDPLGGLSDLTANRLRACSAHAFENDPVRILRAIRFAVEFDLHIMPETRQKMREQKDGLVNVSAERIRDELFNILNGPRVATSLRALDMLSVLEIVLPDLVGLKNLAQTAPHVHDAWAHTLDTVKQLENLLNVLGLLHNQDASGSLLMGLTVMRIGRYRQQIQKLLKHSFVTGRYFRSLLFLAALYHDVGKPSSPKHESEQGRMHFLEHEHVGAEIAVRRGKLLNLSNAEVAGLDKIVRHHMRPTSLARQSEGPGRRATYRFFQETDEFGVAVCLLSLADLLATYGPTLPQQRWARQLDVVRVLFEGWWEHYEEQVNPPVLVTGNEIMHKFELKPGAHIGVVLELIREEQAAGQVISQNEAIEFAADFLTDQKNGET